MSATSPHRGKDKTVRDGTAFLRSLYEHASIGIEQVSSDGRLLLANTALCRMLGYTQQELLNKRFDELLPAEDRERENRLLRDLFAGNANCYDGSKRFVHRSGALIRASITSFVIEHDTSTRSCISLVREFSDLAAVKAQLGMVVDSGPLPMLLVDELGTIVLVNAHAEKLLDYRAGELQGESVEILVTESARSKHLGLRRNFFEHPEERTIGRVRELAARSRDGTSIPVEITLHPVEIEGHRWVLAFLVDIRERQRVATALAKSEEKFAKAFQGAPIALTLTSTKDSRYLDVNDTFLRLTGFTREEVIGRTPFDTGVWASPPEKRHEFVRRALAGEALRAEEFQFRTKDGTIRSALGSMEILDIDGEKLAFSAVLDITDRKNAQEQLEQSEKTFRSVFQSAPSSMVMASPEGKFLKVNKAFCDFVGYTEQEILALDIVAITHPDDRPATIARLKSLGIPEDSERLEKRYLHKNGQTRWGYLSRTLIRDADGKPAFMVSQIVDITERKIMDAALRQTAADLKEAQRVARVGSWTRNPLTDAISWSDEMYRIHGRDPSLGPPTGIELEKCFTPESYARLAETRRMWNSGDIPQLDLELVRPDGEKRWIATRAEAERDHTGRVVMLRGTAQDITERKRAEEALRGMSGKLIEAQERERKRIARELHDDINQRLAIVAVELQQMQSEPHLTPAQLHKQIDKLFKQTTDIASSIQALSHQLHSASLEYLGLAPAIKNLCEEITSHHHQVHIDYTSSNLPDAITPEMSLAVFRVAQEALNNAVKHSGVKKFDVHLEGSPDEIQLTVRDSGVGFGLESAMAGHGLGLISMRERILPLNGTVSIVSKPQHGTEVRVRVPLVTTAQK